VNISRERKRQRRTAADVESAKRYGILYEPEQKRLTYLPTGRVVDLVRCDWLAEYIPRWSTIDFILHGMGMPEPVRSHATRLQTAIGST
jgi:hypothetical protein